MKNSLRKPISATKFYPLQEVRSFFLYTWVHASWIFYFNNCPTRCGLFSLLHFCRQLYMFRVLTPFIRSSYNCIYSFWYQLINTRNCNYSCTSSWWWVSTPEICRAAYRNAI